MTANEPTLIGRHPGTLGHWREHAGCAGADPEQFFPHPTNRTAAQRVIDAYCSWCPVQADCLADGIAISTTDRYRAGIWGGTQLGNPNARTDPEGRHAWTYEQMRAANTAHDAHRSRGGPPLTDEQADAYRAYQRTRLALRRQQRSQERAS